MKQAGAGLVGVVVSSAVALMMPVGASALPSPEPDPPHVPFSKDAKVAQTLSPPPPTPTLVLNDFDRYFVAKMRSEGWIVTDLAMFVNNARIVCSMFRAGADPTYVNNRLVIDGGMSMSEALMFSSRAMLTYPDCP